ncbi:MAG: ion transporter [Flavobacteriales bacterium]|nr:ion transporter [Flavobacteriales bacterium]
MTPKSRRTYDDLKPWQQRLYQIIFGYESRAGKLFDVVLLWAILLSVLAVMLESVKEIREANRLLFSIAEWSFTVLFTIEYVARISSSPEPRRYVTSFMGIVDLLSLLPTYLGLFISGTSSLMIIRSIRLIRVFRVLKLTHFVGGANQIGNALYNSRFKIIVFLGTVVCVTAIMGTLMYLVEGPKNGFTSIPRSIYWAIVTVTTVGYGDIAPHTVLGQSLASLLMITGYAIIAVPTGIVTSEMVNAQKNMKSCLNCDAQLTLDKAKYCHNCGIELPKQVFPDQNESVL